MVGNACVPQSPVERAHRYSLIDLIIYFYPIEMERCAIFSCFEMVLYIVKNVIKEYEDDACR